MSGGFDAPLDLRAHVPGEWLLLRPFGYVPEGWSVPITVPAGFVTDLASIPALLRPVFDRNDASRQPAVLHDWLYCEQPCDRDLVDSLFLEALERAGVGFLRRWAMYAGVRAAGWLYWQARDRNPLNPDDFAALTDKESPHA